ncbi:replication regulatory protein RepA [Enterobacter kobei]|uniref:replication regulatory protein RepA n=1 Tax=Enterobacter kobei TaxID=208224 RepID=UPI001252108D|nr:replication regulatory protein RepA [Enterobacter kobei]VAL18896.1 replication protein [Enterobacter kobei]
MSQAENAVTSSSKEKRQYRKGHPLSASERQQSFVARKRETHKEIKILVPKELKSKFQEMCAESGLSQAELFSHLIDKAT